MSFFFVISVLSVIFFVIFLSFFFVISVLYVIFLSFFCSFQFCLSFFCHFSKNFSIFFTIFEKLAPKRQKKNDKFSTKWQKNDKKTTNKMALLQLAKIAFFSKHCHFLSFFCHFSKIFSIFFTIFEKLAPKRQKMTNFPQNDQKMTKKRQTKWRFCRWQKLHFSRSIVIFLSFLCHFSHFFSICFTIFKKIVRK